jgi:hypothetical protein
MIYKKHKIVVRRVPNCWDCHPPYISKEWWGFRIDDEDSELSYKTPEEAETEAKLLIDNGKSAHPRPA